MIYTITSLLKTFKLLCAHNHWPQSCVSHCGTAREPRTTANQPVRSRVSVKTTACTTPDRSQYGPITKIVGLANVLAVQTIFFAN